MPPVGTRGFEVKFLTGSLRSIVIYIVWEGSDKYS